MKKKLFSIIYMVSIIVLAAGLQAASTGDSKANNSGNSKVAAAVTTKLSQLSIGALLQTQYRYIDAPIAQFWYQRFFF